MTHGIKEHTEGGVTAAFYSYRSMHTDIVEESIIKAVPESKDWEGEGLKSGFFWFKTAVSYLREMRFADELTEAEAMLKQWWDGYEDAMRSGDWREVWEGYALLPYEIQLVLMDGYNKTRRQVIGASEGLAGDSKDPKSSKPAPVSAAG